MLEEKAPNCTTLIAKNFLKQTGKYMKRCGANLNFLALAH